MDEFRAGTTRVLITTDVWARGLDVQQASCSQFILGFLTCLTSLCVFLFLPLKYDEFRLLQYLVYILHEL